MSGAAGEPEERENEATPMGYDPTGGIPWYVVVAWGGFAVAYIAYHLVYLLPDLKAWFQAGW